MDQVQLLQATLGKGAFNKNPPLLNMMNYGSSASNFRSELSTMVSRLQQNQPKPSIPSSIGSGPPSMACSSQVSHMKISAPDGYSGWPSQISLNLSQANCVDGSANWTACADACIGKERHLNSVTGGRILDGSFVSRSMVPESELLTHCSSSSRGAPELVSNTGRHRASSLWLMESERQRQRYQKLRTSSFLSTNCNPYTGDTTSWYMGSGLRSQSSSALDPASSGGLRVHCVSCFGVPIGGQLCLTYSGRLGVICSCHNQHISVRSFTQHLGIKAANPGEVVLVESGETLVQWRKSFFSQYGVNVPEDNVGWDWLDVYSFKVGLNCVIGNRNYEAVPTQGCQKEVNGSGGKSSLMTKSRTTQMWDVSSANKNVSTPRATESVLNTKHGLLKARKDIITNLSEALSRNYEQPNRDTSISSDMMSGQFYEASTHETLLMSPQNLGSKALHCVPHSGLSLMSNGNNFIHDESQPYSFLLQQLHESSMSNKGVNHPVSKANEEQLSHARENGISTKVIETLFSSMTISNVEHPNPHLFEQIMRKVWDGKLQHNLQQFNSAELPKFSCILRQTGGRCAFGMARKSVPVNVDRLDNHGLDKPAENVKSDYCSITPNTRQMPHPSQAGFKPDHASQLQMNHMSLECMDQSTMLSNDMDFQVRAKHLESENLVVKIVSHPGQCRSVMLENTMTLDSLSSGASMEVSNKTGQRLLEIALQSSFAYRARGLESLHANLNAVPVRRMVARNVSGAANSYARPTVGSREFFWEFLASSQSLNDLRIGSGRTVDSGNVGRAEEYSKRAISMREQELSVGRERGIEMRVIGEQNCPEVLPLSGEDIHCSCLICRRSCPSARGQAVPRFVEQVLLKEKAYHASIVVAGTKVALAEADRNAAEESILDKYAGTEPEVYMEAVEVRNEDFKSNIISNRIAAERGALGGDEFIPEMKVCSNNSEVVSSSLCDEGYFVRGKGEPLSMKVHSTLCIPIAVDEGSGVGKYSSSDDLDVNLSLDVNVLSALKDLSEGVASPSSLGCPSSRNMRKRLMVKKSGNRGAVGYSEQDIEDNAVEADPVEFTGKLQRKQCRDRKWKWTGSSLDEGDDKEDGPECSFGQQLEPQITSEDAIGSQVHERPTRSDGWKKYVSEVTAELPTTSKRRKLFITRCYQGVKATNVTEENLEAAYLGETGTLTIRVPQNLNHQEAKTGIQAKTHLRSSSRDCRVNANVEARISAKGGGSWPKVGKSKDSTQARVGVLRPTASDSDTDTVKTGVEVSIEMPNIVTKGLRSPTTPPSGPNPRNGRMVSLSVILNHTAGAGPVSIATQYGAPLYHPRDGAPEVREEGASVFEFLENEVLRAPKQVTVAVQTENAITRAWSVGMLGGYFPRGERSVRTACLKRRRVEWPRSNNTWIETGNMVSRMEGTFVCEISQVRSIAGSNAFKEKLQRKFDPQSLPIVKQVRSNQMKRNKEVVEGLQTKNTRVSVGVHVVQIDSTPLRLRHLRGQMKAGLTGNGVLKLKRPSEQPSTSEFSAKRPKVVHVLKKSKDSTSITDRTMGHDELLKSCKRVLHLGKKIKKTVQDPLIDAKLHNKNKSQLFDANGRSSIRNIAKEIRDVQTSPPGRSEKFMCDVCGILSSPSYNKLLCCARCPVKVHQACYGVPKVPKGPWSCRTCKSRVVNPICVLCGYGGGAMTRVHKARDFCLGLLQTWRDVKGESVPEPFSKKTSETPLSAVNNMKFSRGRLSPGLRGVRLKNMDMKVRKCELCGLEELEDDSSVCKACLKHSSEPGSSGGSIVKWFNRGVNSKAEHESWKSNNTVRSIVHDAGAKQWAHMVCTLWMPGTRCLNMGTMGSFDVSRVTNSRRKALCSICHKKGGACMHCRVPKCSTPFHVWCAHKKGLLQSEIVKDGSNQVGFFGRCQNHGDFSGTELEDVMEDSSSSTIGEICARSKGYKGRPSLEERAKAQQQMTFEGFTAVTPEQVAAWLRISDRKLFTRRLHKSANFSMKFDHKEYLRFKQKKGWKKLAVFKSSIHALGLYTTDFIAEGEVVVEYVGEIVGHRVADEREVEYHSRKRLQYQGACYLFRIDTEQIIDATRKGGIARFVNHSCSPNCVAKVICVESLKKVIFFAKRNIDAGEEVTYDYKFNYDEVGDKIPCFCGTLECRGTLN